MANIEKRGESYRITVSCGYDVYGRKKRAHMTWKPDNLDSRKRDDNIIGNPIK